MYCPPIIPTPTELVVSSSSKGQVTKKLILRNNLSSDILLKLVLAPEDAKFIHPDADRLRIASRTVAELTVQIYTDRVGMWNKSGHNLTGYVRVVDNDKIPELTRWINTNGAETKRQKAFSLAIKFADEFSAPNTVIDLPGSALMVWADGKGPVGVEDVVICYDEEKEAVRTARDCESIADYVKKMKAMKRTDGKGWLSTWLGETKETINHKMEATPCAGRGY